MDQDLSRMKTPPEGMSMPYIPQIVFTVILHIPVLGFILLGIQHLIYKKSPTLLYFIVGGYLCSFLEAIVDINGMCYFPMDGQIVGIYDYERGVPLFVVGTYSWFMGGQSYLFKIALDSGSVTKSGLWQRWITTMLVNLIVEIPMLLLGMYCYYGPQPFKILGFPIWWLIVNTMIPISSGFAIHVLNPYLKGWKSLFTILIIPMADGFSNLALAWPVWCALHSEYGFAATYPAFFLTLGLGCLTVWTITLYLVSKAEPNLTDAEHEPLVA